MTYELEGCQKAVDFLTEYYEVRRLRTILNGKLATEMMPVTLRIRLTSPKED